MIGERREAWMKNKRTYWSVSLIDGWGEPTLLCKQMSVFIDSYLYLNTHHNLPLLSQWGGVSDHRGIRSLANWLSSLLVKLLTNWIVAKCFTFYRSVENMQTACSRFLKGSFSFHKLQIHSVWPVGAFQLFYSAHICDVFKMPKQTWAVIKFSHSDSGLKDTNAPSWDGRKRDWSALAISTC